MSIGSEVILLRFGQIDWLEMCNRPHVVIVVGQLVLRKDRRADCDCWKWNFKFWWIFYSHIDVGIDGPFLVELKGEVGDAGHG